MKTFLRIFFILIIIAIFGGTLYYLYQKNQEKPVVYETATPFHTDIVKKTVATGSVVPRKEVDIKSRVSGIVDEIFVEAGRRVKKGTLLARIKIIPDMVTLNNAESRVDRAKINLKDAEEAYQRQKRLYEEKVISEADFQSFRTAMQNAEQELEAAESNLELIKEGVTKKAGESSNTLIRATVPGMVLDVPVKEGNSVIESNTFNEGTTIATVADMNEMVFEGKVDESEVGKIREGMELVLKIGALENVTFPAKLEYISPKGVEEDGAIQFEIKAAIQLNDTSFIRAGYSANADIVLEKVDSVLAIKESLLQFEGDSAFVEVENGKQEFEKRYVKTGLSDGINIQILSGIEKDTRIKDPNSARPEGKKKG